MADHPTDHEAASRVTACTVVARNYLPAATVLARSYLKHHPRDRFVIEVIDAPFDFAETEGHTTTLGPAALGIDRADFLRMATAYSVTELATAVKPYLLTTLRRQSEVVMYIDPDIKVFAPFPEIAEAARAHELVLTPHNLEPMPRDGFEPDESVIMGTGIFNLGFLACGPGSEHFLAFWRERLRHDAIDAPAEQLFTDQRWVDQVPALFRHVVCTDRGANVAYWNAHERPVQHGDDGAVTAGGSPLKFFHFSGYRPEKPWLLTFHCGRAPRVRLSQQPVIKALCDEYGADLRAAGYAESLEAVPYGFAALADGTKLTTPMRRLFRAEWIAAENQQKNLAGQRETPIPEPPSAFEDAAEFIAWLSGPTDRAQRSSGLNRLLMAIWSSRGDLQRTFPRPYLEDAAGFRLWCRTSGVDELGLPAWALPAAADEPTEPDTEFGVNVLGYLTAELGLGEMARLLVSAVEEAGIPIASVVEEKAVSNRTALARPESENAPRFGVSLLCVNADQTQVMAEAHPDVFADRYRIGFWAWELEDFPEWLHSAFRDVDEIWTISEFCRKAISQHTTLPVKVFPAPIRPVQEMPERTESDTYQFLFAFDFNSVGERKNPWGTVEAFQRAFPEDQRVRLVIKAINGNRHPIDSERLRVAVSGDDRITLLERYLSVAELEELYRASDCYVSLHRSEGFGLTVAQSMAMGIPTISTDYSGTTEFLDESTGYPIPYSLVEVGDGCFPYHPQAVWAAPDLTSAAEAMRRVVEQPAEARRRADAALAELSRGRTMAAAADWVGRELAGAHERWLERRQPPPPPRPIPDPLGPARSAREAVTWRADAGDAARNPVAPAIRRSVLRLLDHYDVHQRSVLGALHDGSTETDRLLLQRIEWLEAKLDGVAAELADRSARLDTVEVRNAQLQQDLQALQHAAPATASALRDLGRNVQGISGERREIDEIREQLAVHEKSRLEMHDQAIDRDQRADRVDHDLSDQFALLDAVESAARLRHAPVPAGADVVLCDAGALLLPIDDVILPWIRYHRSWEAAEAALIARLMRGGAFLDVGAHVGYHTLALLQHSASVSGVVAVEASALNAELLRRNVSVNLPRHARDRVAVVEAAAWDEQTTLSIAPNEQGNSGDIRVRAGDASAQTVQAVRLDENAAVLALGRVDVIKLDLQGRDHRAVRGLRAVIQRDRPDLVVEFSPAAITEFGDTPADALTLYRELGYEILPITDRGADDHEPSDARLTERAIADEAGLLTLWLRPAR